MSHREHMKNAPRHLRVGVLTLSDTRSEAEDKSGKLLKELLTAAGHSIAAYEVVKEDSELMLEKIQSWISRSDVEVIICNGGTGITARDGTVEVARSLFSKELEGFGEIFRLVSYQQIGAAAMLSRACAGLASGKILICLPGSSKAVKLATERLILPQLPHMVWESRR